MRNSAKNTHQYSINNPTNINTHLNKNISNNSATFNTPSNPTEFLSFKGK